MRKRLMACLLMWALVFLGSGWAAVAQDSPSSGDLDPLPEPVTVRIAEDGAASGAGFYIADARGYFKQYNIDVEWVSFINSDDMLPAVAAGQLDVAGGITSAALFNAVAQGFDVRIISDKGHDLPGRSYFTLVIRKGLSGQIRSYEQMKGLTVSYSSADSVDQYMTVKALEAGGLTEQDVKVVVIQDFAQILAALASGSVDVAMEIEPFITRGVEQGIIERFNDTTEYLPRAQAAVVLGSPRFVANHDVALRFMLAYLKGLRDFNDVFVRGVGDREAVVDIMTRYTPLKEKEMWSRVNPPGLDPDGGVYVDDINRQYEFYKANGALVGDVDLSKVIDLSLAQNAVEILGPYGEADR
ncbi:ABC transporter substrate-binding protein [Limnochorda pilosa]|uniref:Taurine ABC transporter substrate-binding protein n=1 Tax=Limnochorda pilosa TaxID=1555112 RepID=A0A0K2SIA2_LIMPI|nr:ABC transporter substrate-binding protein [Limnochorda pilosa]BAS26856.1 taurine ABC transporter substrate-binding protein [Limnochorda pilosa]